jgi:hypothetical protein
MSQTLGLPKLDNVEEDNPNADGDAASSDSYCAGLLLSEAAGAVVLENGAVAFDLAQRRAVARGSKSCVPEAA